MQPTDRALGCFQAMMIGDAMSYPSMMRGRYMTLPWIDRTMHKIEEHGRLHRNTKPVLPFVWHKSEVLKPTPTYVTEYALFTAAMLNELQGGDTLESIERFWLDRFVAHEQDVRSAVSERAAIVNYQQGYRAPVTGNDHPHTYDDGFVCRAVPIAIHTFRDAARREKLLAADGSVTHADEGLFAGKAMAAAIAAGMNGASAAEMIADGVRELPDGSWTATLCAKALDIAGRGTDWLSAVAALDSEVTSRIYNYGNMAPETLAVAFGLFRLTGGAFGMTLPLSFMFPRLADSVPAFVGALCGVHEGQSAIPESYRDYLHPPQGVCIPWVKELDWETAVLGLLPGGKDVAV